MNEPRLKRVLQNLEKLNLEQAIITSPISIRYLTSYDVEPFERFLALIISTKREPVLFVNSLFPDAAPFVPRIVELSDTDDVIPALLPHIASDEVLGVDQNLSCKWFLPLQDAHAAAGYQLASSVLDDARAVKLPDELDKMRAASHINDECMAWLMAHVREGVTERELAEGLLKQYELHGASGPSFPPIVSFGANAADPHHEPDDTRLVSGNCVLFDVGCVLDEYCSDMTRTAFFGEPSQEFIDAYNLVLKAQEAAENIAAPGVAFSELDKTARDIITAGGYGPNFTHRLGHFIGLQDHETGDVSATNANRIVAGNCFSIEPGIYVEGRFGIRIEDLLITTDEGCEVINHYPKELKVFN